MRFWRLPSSRALYLSTFLCARDVVCPSAFLHQNVDTTNPSLLGTAVAMRRIEPQVSVKKKQTHSRDHKKTESKHIVAEHINATGVGGHVRKTK